MAARCVRVIMVKRTNPRWLDWYGHWWVELGDDESYGWWPDRRPVGLFAAVKGVPGRLNGVGVCPGGAPTRDPRHGELADHAFYPDATDDRSDEDVVAAIRAFAGAYQGEWRWSRRGHGGNCRTFQHKLLSAAGLSVPAGYRHTQGGCPFLGLARRMAALLEGASGPQVVRRRVRAAPRPPHGPHRDLRSKLPRLRADARSLLEAIS